MTKSDREFDWDFLMRFGLGALGLAPSEFWKMTPREFDAAMKGVLGRFGDDVAMDAAGLTALSARFPDEGAGA